MSLLRSAFRSVTARPLQVARYSTPSASASAAASWSSSAPASSSSSSSASSSSQPSPASFSTSAARDSPRNATSNPLSGAARLIPKEVSREDPDAWWRKSDLTQQHGRPGTKYSGRSWATKSYPQAYSRMTALMARTGIRRETQRGEFYEKPSAKRVRVRSENHRRRFQENIRKRVQLVEALRSRQ